MSALVSLGFVSELDLYNMEGMFVEDLDSVLRVVECNK